MDIVLATTNPHKLEEAIATLHPLGLRVIGLNDFDKSFEEPVEDAETFAGNAAIKAIGYAKMLGTRCLADDSGLVVDALGGRPGVHSARFAGIGATREQRDDANNKLLLKELQKVSIDQRTARFVCSMCVAEPDGNILARSEGFFEGLIINKEMGKNGFGYDPLFFIPDLGVTSAEIDIHEKQKRSHRGQALRLIAKHLIHK